MSNTYTTLAVPPDVIDKIAAELLKLPPEWFDRYVKTDALDRPVRVHFGGEVALVRRGSQ